MPQDLDDMLDEDAPDQPDMPEEIGPENDQRTEEQTATQAEEEPECEDCPDCDPRNAGAPWSHYYGDVRAGALKGYDYQHFICPWHVHLRDQRTIGEWMWGGIDYDGLHPAECLLYEVKHGYDDLLIDNGWDRSDRPILDPTKPWGDQVFKKIVARAQVKVGPVAPLYPKVRLRYVFSHSITKLYVGERFTELPLSLIELEDRPFSMQGE